jgi:hypothetical protein
MSSKANARPRLTPTEECGDAGAGLKDEKEKKKWQQRVVPQKP